MQYNSMLTKIYGSFLQGPVKVPPIRNFVNGTSTSSNRSSRCSSTVKDEKESGYESNTNTLYQEFPDIKNGRESREGRDREREHVSTYTNILLLLPTYNFQRFKKNPSKNEITE